MIAGYARECDKALLAEDYRVDQVVKAKMEDAQTEQVFEKPVAKTTRFWIWLTAAALQAVGLVDRRVQLISVIVVAAPARLGYCLGLNVEPLKIIDATVLMARDGHASVESKIERKNNEATEKAQGSVLNYDQCIAAGRV